MTQDLPTFVTLIFGLTVLATIVWFYIATRSNTFLLIALGWTLLQSILGLQGIYRDTESMPPRLLLFGVFPTLVVIIAMFLTRKGKMFIDSIDLKTLTYFHTIRIPVEIVLALLFHHGMVSLYMTFEGTNFDLFSGVTAPLIAWLAFRKAEPRKKLLIAWNVLCLMLLLNVVITAVFALPSPFQKISFDQPNIAVLYFPFNLLPALIVPIVFFGHLAAFRQLIRMRKT